VPKQLQRSCYNFDFESCELIKAGFHWEKSTFQKIISRNFLSLYNPTTLTTYYNDHSINNCSSNLNSNSKPVL
jgi:hypothetical protein